MQRPGRASGSSSLAPGGLGHFAVQFATARGARVIAIDSGPAKQHFLKSLGVDHYVDFLETPDVVAEVLRITGDSTSAGAHAAVVTSGNAKAYAQAADMLRPGGARHAAASLQAGPSCKRRCRAS